MPPTRAEIPGAPAPKYLDFVSNYGWPMPLHRAKEIARAARQSQSQSQRQNQSKIQAGCDTGSGTGAGWIRMIRWRATTMLSHGFG